MTVALYLFAGIGAGVVLAILALVGWIVWRGVDDRSPGI